MDTYKHRHSSSIESFQQKPSNSKRNSMLAYVPAYRRNDEDEQQASSLLKRNSASSNNNKYSNSNRSSVNDLQQPESKRSSLMGSYRPGIHDNDSLDNNEYQQEDWENILKQYDRYSMTDDDKRKSKRASRTLDSYIDLPVEVPIVDEPTVVLDCYDFPPAFKTHHLHDIFRSYEGVRGGYKIKWLSDTRALIIFDHPSPAKKAYIDNVNHALAKIRPYDGPTDFLKEIPNQPSQSSRSSRIIP